MAAIIIEDAIEGAYKAILEANAYVIAQSVNVIKWADNDEALQEKEIAILCNPAAPIMPNADCKLWTAELEVLGATYTADDQSQSSTKATYSNILDVLFNTTLTALNAEVSGLTFKYVIVVPGAFGLDEQGYNTRIGKATLQIEID